MAFSLAVAELGLSSPYNTYVLTAASGYGVDANLIRAIISQESQWNAGAVNASDPSYGLMQILAGSRGPYPTMATDALLDPATNVNLGTQFLAGLIGRYGDTSDAISAYNGGHPLRLATGGYANQDYVDAVQAYWTWYANNPAITGDGADSVPPGGFATDGGLGIGFTLALVGLIAIAFLARR